MKTLSSCNQIKLILVRIDLKTSKRKNHVIQYADTSEEADEENDIMIQMLVSPAWLIESCSR